MGQNFTLGCGPDMFAIEQNSITSVANRAYVADAISPPLFFFFGIIHIEDK
jgi:hypothetical protein